MIVHIMDQRELDKGEGPIGVVVAPTRELAEQIHKETRECVGGRVGWVGMGGTGRGGGGGRGGREGAWVHCIVHRTFRWAGRAPSTCALGSRCLLFTVFLYFRIILCFCLGR
jgi:hypothetical protein